LVYILSSRYSGSTLLSFVLGSHPEISTIGELKKFHAKMIAKHGSAKTCSCGKLFVECEFWSKILMELRRSNPKRDFPSDFSQFEFFGNKYINHLFYKSCLWLNPKHQLVFTIPSLKTKMSNFLDYNYSIIKTANSLYEKNVFLDSSKPLRNLLYLSLDKRYDLYVLHLIRDPRGQVNSSLKYNKWSIGKATRKWIQTLEAHLDFLKKNDLKNHTIQYENFCRNPEKELQKIANFVGISERFEFTKFRETEQHIMGNYGMRLGKDMKIEERIDWLQKLSDRDRSSIENMTKSYKNYYTSSVK